MAEPRHQTSLAFQWKARCVIEFLPFIPGLYTCRRLWAEEMKGSLPFFAARLLFLAFTVAVFASLHGRLSPANVSLEKASASPPTRGGEEEVCARNFATRKGVERGKQTASRAPLPAAPAVEAVETAAAAKGGGEHCVSMTKKKRASFTLANTRRKKGRERRPCR